MLVGINESVELGSARDLHTLAAGWAIAFPFACTAGRRWEPGAARLASRHSRATFHWVLAFRRGGTARRGGVHRIDRLRDSNNPPRLSDPEALLAACPAQRPARQRRCWSSDQPAALGLMPGLRRSLRAGVRSGRAGGIVSV